MRYHTNRQYVYRWMKRYDGTLHSLEDHSHRPQRHPNQHTPEEIKLILNMRHRNPNAGIVVFWVKLRSRGYTRSISGLYRFLRKRNSMAVKLPNPKKYTPKPYEQMSYPGQRVQIDVKFVPKICIVGQEEPTQWYQYTFIDEYTRFRYLEAFPEHSTYSSALVMQHSLSVFSMMPHTQLLDLLLDNFLVWLYCLLMLGSPDAVCSHFCFGRALAYYNLISLDC